MKFWLVLLLLFSCSQAPVSTSHRVENFRRFSVMQSYTDHNSTVIRVVVPKYHKRTYEIKDSKNNLIKTFTVKTTRRDFSEFAVDHLHVKGISLNENYTLSISSNIKGWSDRRTFRALDGKGNRLRALVASCMSDSYNEVGNVLWPYALSQNPDVIFLIGDNVYTDIHSGIYLGSQVPSRPHHLWNRHVDHAMVMKIYRSDVLKPVFTIWDDHDFGVNNGGKSYKYKRESKKIYQTFFPRGKNSFLKKGPGLATVLKIKSTKFIFIDGRTFRDSEKKKKGHHFGKKQRSWIKKQIKGKTDNIWLITGDQFFGAYHPWESFEGNHPKQFKKFLLDLKSQKDKRYAFLSGDRHLIEVMKIDDGSLNHTSMEYTVSGAQTKMFPRSLNKNPNPRRVGGFDGIPNFAIFDIESNSDSMNVNFKAYSDSKLMINRSDVIK